MSNLSKNLFVGVMSGTSLDGVDVVIANLPTDIIAQQIFSYPDDIYESLSNLELDLPNISRLDMRLGRFYADCINQLIDCHAIPKSDIVAIGLHGQTIDHAPNDDEPYTVQIGNANQVAYRTGIQTIADFRTKDIVAGGQGAPLVPAFHQAIFGCENQMVVNIGGIANITYLPKQGEVIGFDTGPGNGLLDEWVKKYQHKNYDNNGDWANKGKVDMKLLTDFLADSYFKKSYPKSTGREYFNQIWLEKFDLADKNPIDIQATLAQLTATTVADECASFKADKLLICGGGAKNSDLIQRLKKLVAPVPVLTEYGVDTDILEALAFAWLAEQTINKKTSNLSSVTGAKQGLILGVIYPP